MAVHGKATAVLVAGYDPSKYFTEITVARTIDTHDSSGFQMDAKEYVAGQNDSTVAASGFWQGDLLSVQEEFEAGLSEAVTANRLYMVILAGWVLGSTAKFGVCLTTTYEVSAPVADLVSSSFNLQGQPGMLSGKIIQVPRTLTVDSNGPTFDQGAAVAGGVTVQVHVTANTMNAATHLIVQDSTNGTTWVDRATVAVPAVTKEAARLVLAGPTNRYIRVIADCDGAGSLTVAAAAAPTI